MSKVVPCKFDNLPMKQPAIKEAPARCSILRGSKWPLLSTPVSVHQLRGGALEFATAVTGDVWFFVVVFFVGADTSEKEMVLISCNPCWKLVC